MEETNRIPLVKNFTDLAFSCYINYTNEQYQFRSSNESNIRKMYSVKKDDMYILNCVFDHHYQGFIKDYVVTGEYNFNIYVQCSGKTMNCALLKSIISEKEELKELVNNNKTSKNNSDSEFVELKMKIYTFNADDDILHHASFFFKKSRYGLIPARVEISLPCDLCDKWYERFTKNDYQESYGPKLL